MSRFKFACSCGKRLAAYDWMVGRLLSCPKCGRTLTVPTPFQAEDQLQRMIEGGYTPFRRRLGRPIRRMGWPARIGLLAGLLAVAAGVACAVLYFLKR
ncbi:MAG TPA: hypothetical protein VMY39_03300 [Planctomycetota bacterium]|nr:hypothetical protein [Planctomycetota bacterium]HUV38608.1 hypothetical protein [Planctomycetota bacterium]